MPRGHGPCPLLTFMQRIARGVETPPPFGCCGGGCARARSTASWRVGALGVWRMWENGLHFADRSAQWIFSEKRQPVWPSQGLCFPPAPSPRRSSHLLCCCTQPTARSACWHYARQLWGRQCQEGRASRRSRCPAKENKVTGKGPGEQSRASRPDNPCSPPHSDENDLGPEE